MTDQEKNNEDIAGWYGKYAIKSRLTVFEHEMKNLQMQMYGGFTHYIISYMYEDPRPFGYDGYDIPDMEYSEENTIDFINEIIDEKKYEKTHTSNVEEHADRLSFYKNILYCVLRTMTSGYTDYRMGNIIGYDEMENLTFSDVISCFEDSSGEILDDRMVYLMRTLYEFFSEKTIDLNVLHVEPEEMELTEEERKQMEEEAEAWTAREEELAKAQGINIDEFREEEQKEIQLSELEGIEKKDWLQKNFKKKEHFCRSLEEICAYLKEHKVKPVEVREDMKAMIFAFLTDRKLSLFENEEDFVEVMAQLKKTIRMAKSAGINEEVPFN